MPDTLENRGLAAKMQGTFFKQQGYLERMFSKETWEEWTENRTELGRVVFGLKDCLESQTRVKNCVNKLDPNDLKKANEQAKIALTPKPLGMPEKLGFQTNSGCLKGIFGGTVGSLIIKHHAPLLLGLSECLPAVSAQQPVAGEFQVNTFTNLQFYPQYYQYTTADFSYVFKFKDASSLDLKIYSVSQKCISKQSLQTENLGQEYIDRISNKKDLSIVLEHLVKIGILSREHFPIHTKIDQAQKLIKTQDWVHAEKVVLEGLEEANESEKMQYYELLEEIYRTLNPEKLERLWTSQAQGYIKLSQFSDAERIYEKAYKHFKSFDTACNLARIFTLLKKINKSVQTYYEAVTIALLNEQLGKISLCIEAIREMDPQMNELDNSQKMFLLMLIQLSRVSEKLRNQQDSLLNFLALAPAQHQATLLNSVLYNAVIQGRVDVVKVIIRYWELVSINECYGNEPLIVTAAQKGNEEMVRELIAHPDMNIGCQQKSGHLLTALALAEQSGFKNIITILYNHSQSLEQDFLAFKKKPLGVVEYLHIHTYIGSSQRCLVVTGIDSEGNKKLLHISCPLKQSLQQELEQLVERGLKNAKFITINTPNPQGVRSLNSFFSNAQIYETQISKIEKPYSLDGGKVKSQFGNDIATIYEELSEKIDDLIRYACVDPCNEAVVYRAIALKGKGYFME